MNIQMPFSQKARLLLLAPYTGLKVLFENIVKEYDQIELTAFVKDTREAAGFVNSLDLSPYDIVISRGYTCDLIEKECQRHVLDVGISIYDVLTSIKLAHNYNGKYVFVGFQSVIYLAKVLKDVLEYDFDVYTVENIQQIEPTLLQLKKLGYNMIIGDVVTTNTANRIGLQSILISTSEESVRKTLKESIEIFNEKKFLYEEIGFHELIEQNLHHTQIAVFNSNCLLAVSTELPRELITLMQANVATTLLNRFSYLVRNLDSTQYSIHGKKTDYHGEQLVIYTIKTHISMDTPVMIKYVNASDELAVSQRLFYSLNASMQKMLYGIQSFKYYTRPILIKGPLYSGKSEIAKYIYTSNKKQNGPLIIINCKRFQAKEWDQFLNKDSSPLYNSEATLFFQNVTQLSTDCQEQLLYYLDSSNAWKRNQIIFSTDNMEKEENTTYFEEELLRDFRFVHVLRNLRGSPDFHCLAVPALVFHHFHRVLKLRHLPLKHLALMPEHLQTQIDGVVALRGHFDLSQDVFNGRHGRAAAAISFPFAPLCFSAECRKDERFSRRNGKISGKVLQLVRK